jgi:hypothetical protein
VRAAVLVALELPCRKAADVNMEYVQSWAAAVAAELNLELQLILRDGIAAHRADHTNSWPAPSPSVRWDGSFPVRISSRAFARRQSRRAWLLSGFGILVMPDARTPVRVTRGARWKAIGSLHL